MKYSSLLKYLIFFICVTLFSLGSFAQENKVIVVLEKRSHIGIENVGIAFDSEKITISSNSNFLEKDYPYRLGLFELKTNAPFKKEILDLIKSDIKKYDATYSSPHSLMIYINGEKIDPRSSKFNLALTLVDKVFKDKNLKIKDGVVITNTEELKKINCESVSEAVCTFKYGYIHL